MLKRAIGLGIVLFMSVVAAVAFWAYGLPALHRTTANESFNDIPGISSEDESAGALYVRDRSGSIVAAKGKTANGTVSLITVGQKKYLRLESDFSVTNGPDLYVAFGNNGKVDDSTLFARLKASQGGQNYELPVTIDPTSFDTVFIYSRAFGSVYATAVLQ